MTRRLMAVGHTHGALVLFWTRIYVLYLHWLTYTQLM